RVRDEKSRRRGTPQGVPRRRLTRQRAPRHGRVALHLVIRRLRSSISRRHFFRLIVSPISTHYTADDGDCKWIVRAGLIFVFSSRRGLGAFRLRAAVRRAAPRRVSQFLVPEPLIGF